MSSTRHAEAGAPLSHERYMSAPEYQEMRGINGTAVAEKVFYLASDPRKRELLLFLQGLSLQRGGLMENVVKPLLQIFPERIGSPTMHEVGIKRGGTYSGKVLDRIHSELSGRKDVTDEELESALGTETEAPAVATALDRRKPQQTLVDECRRLAIEHLEAFLINYCISPEIEVLLPGERPSRIVATRPNAFSRCEFYSFGQLCYFKDIHAALLEFQQMHAQRVREQFIETSVAIAIKETFEKARRRAKLFAIEASEGIGKSETAKALCAMHPGVFRFIDLKGASSEKEIFRAIAKALGVSASPARKQSDMKERVEEFVRKTGIILVIDEAHHMLPSGERIYVQPKLINWAYTVTNFGVAVVLVTTSVFSTRLRSMSRQIVWNIGQVERRMVYRTLPMPTEGDMEAIAKRHAKMKGASAAAIDEAVGYAMESPYPLTALADAILDASEIAQSDGRERITYDDMQKAIGALQPLDKARDEAFHKADAPRRRKRFKAPFNAPERRLQDDTLAEDSMTSTSRLAGNLQQA